MVLVDLEAVRMTRHLISVTLTTEAYDISRLWAERRQNSAMISAAIIHYDLNGPRSKKFVEQEKAVVERERSIAFLQNHILSLRSDLDELVKLIPDDPDL